MGTARTELRQTAVELEVHEENLYDAAQKELFRYWVQLKANNPIPDWQAFDPAFTAKSLPEIMLYDAMKNGDFFVSVIGELCRSELDISAAPRLIEEVIPSENVEDVRQRLTRVRDEEIPHLVRKNRAWKCAATMQEQKEEYSVLFLPFRYPFNGLSHKIINVMQLH